MEHGRTTPSSGDQLKNTLSLSGAASVILTLAGGTSRSDADGVAVELRI